MASDGDIKPFFRVVVRSLRLQSMVLPSVPTEFRAPLQASAPALLTLKTALGFWKVKIVGGQRGKPLQFTTGWAQFVENHNVKLNYTLLFETISENEFGVTLFPPYVRGVQPALVKSEPGKMGIYVEVERGVHWPLGLKKSDVNESRCLLFFYDGWYDFYNAYDMTEGQVWEFTLLRHGDGLMTSGFSARLK